MKFKPTWFIDAHGNICTARDTDQAGRRNVTERTRRGAAVEEVKGSWSANQTDFGPFKAAAAKAQAKAAARETSAQT